MVDRKGASLQHGRVVLADTATGKTDGEIGGHKLAL